MTYKHAKRERAKAEERIRQLRAEAQEQRAKDEEQEMDDMKERVYTTFRGPRREQ